MTPELRTAIIAAFQAGGVPKTEIARQFHVNRKTVAEAIQRWWEHKTTSSRPRSGRPLKYDDRTRRLMARNAHRDRLSSSQHKKVKSSSGSLSGETVAAANLKVDGESADVQLKKKNKK